MKGRDVMLGLTFGLGLFAGRWSVDVVPNAPASTATISCSESATDYELTFRMAKAIESAMETRLKRENRYRAWATSREMSKALGLGRDKDLDYVRIARNAMAHKAGVTTLKDRARFEAAAKAALAKIER